MSTLKLDTLSNKAGTASVPSDTIVSGTAKAWVNFNGTGTVAIRRAFNVSSITDNGTGDYTVNFTTAMPDADYAAFADSDSNPVTVGQHPFVNYKSAGGFATVAPTTSAFRFAISTDGGTVYDQTYISASAFR